MFYFSQVNPLSEGKSYVLCYRGWRQNALHCASELSRRPDPVQPWDKENSLSWMKGTETWPNMRKAVYWWWKNCLSCAMTNADYAAVKGPDRHQCIGGPWAWLEIDLATPLTFTFLSKAGIMVVVGLFLSGVEGIPCKINMDATTAKLLFNIILCPCAHFCTIGFISASTFSQPLRMSATAPKRNTESLNSLGWKGP